MDNKKQRYIIIGRSSCSFCIMAQNFLSAQRKQYVFLDYCDRSEILDDYKSFHNQETVPIILSNDLETGYTKKVGGYTDLLDYLDDGQGG